MLYELEFTLEDLKSDKRKIEKTIASLEETEDALSGISDNEELIEKIVDELEKWKYELEYITETIDALEQELLMIWEDEQKHLELEYLKSCGVLV